MTNIITINDLDNEMKNKKLENKFYISMYPDLYSELILKQIIDKLPTNTEKEKLKKEVLDFKDSTKKRTNNLKLIYEKFPSDKIKYKKISDPNQWDKIEEYWWDDAEEIISIKQNDLVESLTKSITSDNNESIIEQNYTGKSTVPFPFKYWQYMNNKLKEFKNKECTWKSRILHPTKSPHSMIKGINWNNGMKDSCSICAKELRNQKNNECCPLCNYKECDNCVKATIDLRAKDGIKVVIAKNGKTKQFTVTHKNGGKRLRTHNKASRKTKCKLENKMRLKYRMGVKRTLKKSRTAKKRQNGGVAPVGYSIPFGQRQPTEAIMERATTAGGKRKRTRRNKRKRTRRNKRN